MPDGSEIDYGIGSNIALSLDRLVILRFEREVVGFKVLEQEVRNTVLPLLPNR